MNNSYIIVSWLYVMAAFGVISWSLPVLDSNWDNETIDSVNSTKNLYVVKAVVYEIGILTEVDDNDTTSFDSQERVDLTFFDAHTNESHINLGSIPLPIQTNVSGQVLTGIAPINIGAFSSPSELLQAIPLTGSIFNITHSDTAFYKLTTSNVIGEEKRRIVTIQNSSSIPDAVALFNTPLQDRAGANLLETR